MEPDAPVVYTRPEHVDELIGLWAARDDQYARRSLPLTDIEADAIRAGRMREAQLLPITAQRGRAYASAKSWWPPEHGQ